MSKVLFTINYEVQQDKRDEYIKTIRELKTLIKAEGLESYSVYELKGKANRFQEQYIFTSNEAFENFEDDTDERINILVNKISAMTIEHSTKYSTFTELNAQHPGLLEQRRRIHPGPDVSWPRHRGRAARKRDGVGRMAAPTIASTVTEEFAGAKRALPRRACLGGFRLLHYSICPATDSFVCWYSTDSHHASDQASGSTACLNRPADSMTKTCHCWSRLTRVWRV